MEAVEGPSEAVAKHLRQAIERERFKDSKARVDEAAVRRCDETFEAGPESFALEFIELTMPGLGGFDRTRVIRRLRPDLLVLLSSDDLAEELRGIADAACVWGIVRRPAFILEPGEAVGHALLFSA